VRLAFTKGVGKIDTLVVSRPGRADETIDCPKQRIIPHDMVHYAVESVLDARGFLGRVAAGEDASFTMDADADSDAVERLVEVFQGDGWSGGATPAAEMIALYATTCDARDCAALAVDEGTVEAVRVRIVELSRAWDAVPVGGTLESAFDGHQ